MSTPEAVTHQISKLSSPDSKEREVAAHALFRLGCAAAEPLLRSWFADREFRALAASGSALLTVGIAVEPHTFEAIRRRFGQPTLAEVPPDQNVLEFELNFGSVRLDVITFRATGAQGPIAKFLARFGEGIQQVECDVRDVARAVEILRRRFALEPVYPEVREGANHTRVNFFLVPVADDRKLLIELVETPIHPKRR
ncbi:MAG TPA: hypothetical protein VFB23_11810 [Candidatus Acidoferrales bacterium]|nr:hypothetical protein [Candidatus Acidoferrales bacterium]